MTDYSSNYKFMYWKICYAFAFIFLLSFSFYSFTRLHARSQPHTHRQPENNKYEPFYTLAITTITIRLSSSVVVAVVVVVIFFTWPIFYFELIDEKWKPEAVLLVSAS